MAGTASAADPGTAFKLLLSCPAGLPRSRVSTFSLVPLLLLPLPLSLPIA